MYNFNTFPPTGNHDWVMQAMGSAEITKALEKHGTSPNSIVYLEHEEATVGPVKVIYLYFPFFVFILFLFLYLYLYFMFICRCLVRHSDIGAATIMHL
jgi:hypothetical protein